MVQSVEITCINKQPRYDAHERIKSVGGLNADASRWTLSVAEAIVAIRAGKYAFWTKGGGKRANVIIARHNGHEYLKTEADGVQPDNLLALPECP